MTSAVGAESAPPGITIRDATGADLDAITAVAIAGWSHDEQWVYRFPYADEYPEDNLRETRARYAQFLATIETGEYTIMVAERKPDDGSTSPIIMAFSIWQMPGHHIKPALKSSRDGESPSKGSTPENYDRKDANVPRMKLFRKVLNQRKKELLDDVYGERMLHLVNLVTHPTYWRQGAATTLLRWGLDKAERDNLAVTLLASEMGTGLYTKHAFKPVGEMFVQVGGEEETVTLLAMVLQR